MASPFRLFRRHVKPLLAAFVVMLMLSWVVGDSLVSFLAGSRSGRRDAERDARAVAVHWDGGSLTNQQINELVVRRRILNQFLQQVELGGAKTAYEAGVEPRPLHVQRMLGPDTPQQGVEQSVVQTRLFADAARKAGMRVSDETVVQYLDELGRSNVTREDMRDLLNRLQSGGWRISIDIVMDTLREEMLARNFINSHQFAFATVTPQQRWKDWLRVNDRVVVEAAAVPAESFLVDVKEPTEAELVAFFDQYKEREASPDLAYGTTELPSPTPGFRIPRKIDVQFIAANYDDFVTKSEEKVTDEEIAKFYEEHKDPMFIKADTGLIEDTGEKKDADKNQDAAKPDKEGASETKSSEATPPPGGATEDQKPAEGGETKPPADAEKGEAAPAEEKKTSQQIYSGSGVFRLAAFQQDEPKQDAAATDAGATPDSKASEPAGGTTPSTTTEQPAPVAAPPTVPSSPTDAATKPATPESPAAATATAEAPPKKPVAFQPLDEVKDVIRRQLAEGKVAEQLTALTSKLEGQLTTEFNKYFSDTLNAQVEESEGQSKQQERKTLPPPKSLVDLAPLAEKNGMKHGQTGPMSFLALRDAPIGKSAVADSGRSFLSMLFGGRELDLYQPTSTVDLDGNRYVLMKMSDTPDRVPALADVRDEVVRAWKQQKAAELAQKHAEELATKAQDAKSPLASFFADDQAVKVVRTDPFSELTGGDVGIVNGQLQQQPYRLSQPEGIVAPGPDLIKRVFELKEGEVGAALNHDHSIAYVVRVVEHQPSLEELRTAYLAEANSWPGQNNMTQGHMQEIWSNLRNDILVGANLKWERQSDRIEQRGEKDEG